MKSYINKIQLFREVDVLHKMLVQILILNLSKLWQTSGHDCWKKNGPPFHSNIIIEFIRWFLKFSLIKNMMVNISPTPCYSIGIKFQTLNLYRLSTNSEDTNYIISRVHVWKMNLLEIFLFCFIKTKQNVMMKIGLDKTLFSVDFQRFFYKVDLL